jgi:hypothetical protein
MRDLSDKLDERAERRSDMNFGLPAPNSPLVCFWALGNRSNASWEKKLMALDRRQYPRHNPSSLIPVNLGARNEGMLLNLSEGGLAFQVVAPVESNATVHLMCMLEPDQTLVATGEIIRTSETRKAGGLRFTDLSEPSRKLITDWLAQSPVQLPMEPAAESLPKPSLGTQRGPSSDVSAGAEAEASGAMPLPGEVEETASMPMRGEAALAPQQIDQAGVSRGASTGAAWRALSSYEWLQEPVKPQRAPAQASRGPKNPLEWILAIGCVVLGVAALLIWTEVFRSIDGRAGGPAGSTGNAPAEAASPAASATPFAAGQASPADSSSAQTHAQTPAPAIHVAEQNQTPPGTGVASNDSAPPALASQATARSPADSSPSNTSREPGEKELIQALHYLNGTNGPKDTAAAVTWFWQAVQKGNQEAAVRLAGLYLRGDGVAKSCDQARILLTTAAQKGNREAAQRLATLSDAGCQ